jgi:hypothetical protein
MISIASIRWRTADSELSRFLRRLLVTELWMTFAA